MIFWAIFVVLTPKQPPPPVESTPRILHCGVAAVYGVSRLLGIDTNPEALEASIVKADPSADLSALSLLQIVTAFQRLGLQASAKQCSPAESYHLKTPFVAYFFAKRADRSADMPGHVVIVTFLSRDRVRILDLTELAVPVEVPFSEFRDAWSGYYVEVSRAESDVGLNWAAGWPILGIASLLAFIWALRRSVSYPSISQSPNRARSRT